MRIAAKLNTQIGPIVNASRMLPEADRLAFIDDVLDAYARLDGGTPGEPRVFVFYQMQVELRHL